VLRRDAFVAKIAVDLVDAGHAAHDEPLQIQLGRDSQEELEIQGVVVRHERPRERASRDRLHHRRLDLEVPPCVEEAAEEADDRRAFLEDGSRFGIDGQVEMPFPVAPLDVFQAVPFLRERAEALGQECQLARLDRKFSRARAEDLSLDADPVAQVQGPEDLPGRVPDRVLARVDLEPR
jgi:hypothetical protein